MFRRDVQPAGGSGTCCAATVILHWSIAKSGQRVGHGDTRYQYALEELGIQWHSTAILRIFRLPASNETTRRERQDNAELLEAYVFTQH